MTRIYPIIAGVVAGFLGSLAVEAVRREPNDRAPHASIAAPERTQTPPLAPPGWGPFLRMAAVEGRLGIVEAKLAAGADVAREGAVGSAAPAPVGAREEQRQKDYDELLARHQADVDAHYRERPDPATGEQRAGAIRGGLGRLTEANHFEVADIDCRVESCVAELVFAHPADALRAQRDLVAARGLGGGRSIALPVPTSGGAYRATLYYATRP